MRFCRCWRRSREPRADRPASNNREATEPSRCSCRVASDRRCLRPASRGGGARAEHHPFEHHAVGHSVVRCCPARTSTRLTPPRTGTPTPRSMSATRCLSTRCGCSPIPSTAFGMIWIDRAHNGWIGVGFDDADVEAHQAALESRVSRCRRGCRGHALHRGRIGRALPGSPRSSAGWDGDGRHLRGSGICRDLGGPAHSGEHRRGNRGRRGRPGLPQRPGPGDNTGRRPASRRRRRVVIPR